MNPPPPDDAGGPDLDAVDLLIVDEAVAVAARARGGTRGGGAESPVQRAAAPVGALPVGVNAPATETAIAHVSVDAHAMSSAVTSPVLVVVGDRNGALIDLAAARLGAREVRVFQDALGAERLVDARTRCDVHRFGLEPALVADADLVLARLPKHSLELEQLTALLASHAADGVQLVAGGRVKYMGHGMNDVLARGFERVRASLGRQKARVLHASGPRRDHDIEPFPRRARIAELDIDVAAHGGVFAGTRLDIGTRALLDALDDALDLAGIDERSTRTAVDLGCGTALISVALARARPAMRVIATDRSWAAWASASATIADAGLADRVEVMRDEAAATIPAASVDIVLLNPPFHDGFGLDDDAATPLFRAAARILRPGGSLITVFNAHLPHRTALRRIVGPTQQLARTPKFIVTRSIAS